MSQSAALLCRPSALTRIVAIASSQNDLRVFRMNAAISARMDTRGLERAILDVVPETRRTVAEQCVTSIGMILMDTQTYGDNTIPFVDIGRMDAELDAPATNSRLAGLGFTEGDAIVMARGNPDSNFNRITGSRWTLTLPGGGIRGFGKAYGKQNAVQMFLQSVVRPITERMRMARHSSGHFLQSGFKWAIQQCVSSPLFKNRYRARSVNAPVNPLNRSDASQLGRLDMTSPDVANFSITAENNVGQDGNAVLDAKHRQALVDYASGPVQASIGKEEGICIAELEKRLALKFEKTNKMLA